MTMRHIDADERRRRLVVRHHLDRSAVDAEQVVRDVVAMHSSDPVTPYLAAWARVPGFAVADLDKALYDDRELWRMHAMRRTLWVVPRHSGREFDVAFAQKVAATERTRLAAWLTEDDVPDAADHIARLEERVLATLRREGELGTRELGGHVEGLGFRTRGGSTSLASKIPFLLACDGRVVRGRPAGSWRSSQYLWVATDHWFEEVPDAPEPRDARAGFTRRWLRAFGPATRIDLKWFTKWTNPEMRDALVDVGAVEVELDAANEPGLVLPDDLDVTPAGDPTVALLPGLDPTIMGWKEREWYVDDAAGELFDNNGNSGPVVVVDGRVVGGWGQDPDGVVITELTEGADPGTVENAAAELTEWLDGEVVSHRFPSGLSRRLASG